MTIHNIKVEDYGVGPINITGWRFAHPIELSAKIDGNETMKELAMGIEKYIAEIDPENIDNNSSYRSVFYPKCMTKNYVTDERASLAVLSLCTDKDTGVYGIKRENDNSLIGNIIYSNTSWGQFVAEKIEDNSLYFRVEDYSTGDLLKKGYIKNLENEIRLRRRAKKIQLA